MAGGTGAGFRLRRPANLNSAGLMDMPMPDSAAFTGKARAEPGPALPRRLRRILSLMDFEAAARRHLPHAIFAYLSGGAEDNASFAGNYAAFRTNH